MVWYLKLRYRLMPYIYSMAADTHYNSGTMMRGLVMDFPKDERVKNIKDQYMFGPALMVAPVTSYGARERTSTCRGGLGRLPHRQRHKGGARSRSRRPEPHPAVRARRRIVRPAR
jgi:alpha-D-xyloside xylohydrolase